MEAISGVSPDSPSASIFCGVSARANNFTPALLTETSVAWADSTTATSRVKGFLNASSVCGDGAIWAKWSKIAWMRAFSAGDSRLRFGAALRLGRAFG